MSDPGWVLKEPLRNSSSPTRTVLPKSQAFYNQLALLMKTRNAYFHNQGSGSSAAALEVIQLLLQFALAIPLDFCAKEYAEAIRRISKLNAGEDFLDAEGGLARIRALEQQVADLEELANQNRVEIQERERQLEGALDDVAIREEALRELQETVGDKDQVISAAKEERETAARIVESLRGEYETKIAELALKETKEREYKELLRALVGSKTVESLRSSGITTDADGENDLQPGEIWVGDKGSRRLTLSVNFRELYDTKTGMLLRDLHGEAATLLAQKWLEIKPQGGRIFVDKHGRATAYRGEDLIYMGEVGFSI